MCCFVVGLVCGVGCYKVGFEWSWWVWMLSLCGGLVGFLVCGFVCECSDLELLAVSLCLCLVGCVLRE